MTTEIFEDFEKRRSKMCELAFDDEGRRLSGIFERLNFLRESLVVELQNVSDECDEAMYNYMLYVGMQLPSERLGSMLQAIQRAEERREERKRRKKQE